MLSRRHLLLAIFNANLERFHFTSDEAPAEIKQEGLIWLNEANVLELSDSEDENGILSFNSPSKNILTFFIIIIFLSKDAEQVDQEPFEVEDPMPIAVEDLIDFISEPESDNENGIQNVQYTQKICFCLSDIFHSIYR